MKGRPDSGRSFALPGRWGRVEVSHADGSRVGGRVMLGAGETIWSGAGPVPSGRYLILADAAGEAPWAGTAVRGSILLQGRESAPR